MIDTLSLLEDTVSDQKEKINQLEKKLRDQDNELRKQLNDQETLIFVNAMFQDRSEDMTANVEKEEKKFNVSRELIFLHYNHWCLFLYKPISFTFKKLFSFNIQKKLYPRKR